jgi:hypothetical protein
MNPNWKARLWNKVEVRGPDECWPWLAAKNAYGYGVLRVDDKTIIATRLVWQDVNGSWPGMKCVLHTCDNRECCNPKHHFLGSRADNIADMCAKGRRRSSVKISDAEVSAIRGAPKVPIVTLADRFGVSKSLISIIRSGKHRAAA